MLKDVSVRVVGRLADGVTVAGVVNWAETEAAARAARRTGSPMVLSWNPKRVKDGADSKVNVECSMVEESSDGWAIYIPLDCCKQNLGDCVSDRSEAAEQL